MCSWLDRQTHSSNNSTPWKGEQQILVTAAISINPFSRESSFLPLSLSLFLKLQICPFNYFEHLLCIFR